MEELFRFLLTRPAERLDPEDRSVPVSPSKEYGTELKRARGSTKPANAVKQAAERHAASRGALHSLDELKLAEPLKKLSGALEDSETIPPAELAKGIKELFGSEAAKVVADDRFKQDGARIGDALITNAILGDDRTVSTDDAASYALAMAVIERAAAGDESLGEEGAIADAMARTLLLPPDVFPLPGPLTRGREAAPPTDGKPTHDGKREILDERNRLLATYTILTRVSPEHLAEPTDAQIEAFDVAPAKVPLPPVPAVRDYDRTTAEEAELERHERGEATVERSAHARARDGIDEAGTARTAAHVVGAPLLLRNEVVEELGRDERAVLEERGLDLTRVSLPTAVERLAVELQEIETRTVELNGATGTEMIRVGKSLLPKDAAIIGAIGAAHQLPAQVPATRGDVAPAGIGDLLVVRQALKRYEARELAHVENVLQGEYKERAHRRARTTEETITTEVETKREEERDLQSTERFELKTESSEILKEDTSLKVGLAVSGKYGPVVEFKASTDFAMNHAKEESKKIASSFSKDVTTRASSRISERRREERILKTIEVFEEANKHGIDNKDGTGHVVGQYQWLDKIFEAQVFNYGKRLLFDITLPEPAAFLLHALSNGPKPGAELVKPVPFTLRATDITEWNYTYYAKQYGAVGISPPPQPYVTISKAVEGKGTQDDGATKALEVPLPDGYQAISAFTTAWYNRWAGGTVDVTIGDNQHRFSDNGGWFASMSSEVGSVPFAMKTWKASAFAVTFELHCQRTQRALDDWKLKTHAAILTAYEKQLADYEDKLAELEVQAGIQIQGRNPVENDRLVRAELKKGAISLFTGQHYDLFGAITLSAEGYPQANLPEAAAEGKYIRFFEQAFEWEQMMFFFYPYFWGRKPNWIKRALLQDVDPLFAEFLKAGSVRVVVSVRPGFEQAIAHFLDTGQIWNGGNLPPISSPLYLSIIEEIRERDQAPGAEVAHGDPWDVRLPTTLVRIRPDLSLPSWKKNPQGEWVPA